jgi:hydrogenase maturation protease
VILVDAVPRGGRPGTLYVLEPELDAAQAPDVYAPLELHELDPWKVLHLARSLGGTMDRVLLVGCEPQPMDSEDMRMEMSEAAQAAVEEAVHMIESLVTQLRADGPLQLEW